MNEWKNWPVLADFLQIQFTNIVKSSQGSYENQNLNTILLRNNRRSLVEIKMSLPECVNLFEIVAPVESVEETGMVGYGKRPEMLKFVIENDDGREIQCIARNEQIMRLKPLIKINEMIHMRKFISRRDSLACFASEAPLVLTIDRSTVIKLAKDNGKNDVDERFRSIHEPKTIRFGVPPSESWGSLSQQIL